MSLIDLILNVAGLLLWFNWRAARYDPLATATPSTLAGTLRRAVPPRFRRWHLLAALAVLILLRAVIYHQIGPAVNWTGKLELGAISISFRSDLFSRTLLFSVLSFGVTLAAFYLWLLFLSLLKRPAAETDALQRLLRLHLGRVDGWPAAAKAVLPMVAVSAAWGVVSWPLAHWAILPRPGTAVQQIEQALVVGLGSYLAWKYLIVGLLTLYLINSYVYFGNHAFWNHVNVCARQLLRPLRWLPLRVGKVDFAPVLGSVLVLLVSRLLEAGLTTLYLKLPL